MNDRDQDIILPGTERQADSESFNLQTSYPLTVPDVDRIPSWTLHGNC